MSDFWTRRRAAVEAEAHAEATAPPVAEAAEETRSDAEILAELNLKAPEELQPGDDFSAFMQAAVPDRLRRRALRVLWRTNPVLANLDDLVDYGEDFTDAATVIGTLQTTYQVGKGMLAHVEALAAEAATDAPVTEMEPAEPLAVAPAEAEPAPEPAPEPDIAPPEMAAAAPAPEDIPEDEAHPAPPRRMRFAYG